MSARSIRYSLTLCVLALGLMHAQERQPPATKPEPETRRMDVQSPVQETRSPQVRTAELPTIDLPEFVITGLASIDLPAVEKEVTLEGSPHLRPSFRDPLAEGRDRTTVEFAAREKQDLPAASTQAYYGYAVASMATYFTPRLGVWLGRWTPEYHLAGGARYDITRGFAPYTNRSGGGLFLDGGLSMHSSLPLFDRSTAGGRAEFASQTYRFYGSSAPSNLRMVTEIGLEARLESQREIRWEHDLALRHKNFVVSDSSATTTENLLELLARSNVPIGSTSLLAGARLSVSSLSGASSDGLPYAELSIGLPRIWWGDFFWQASLHGYAARGMQGQKLTRGYPHLALGYRLSRNTVLAASYEGSVQPVSLASQMDLQPYLAAGSLLRHTDVRTDAGAFLETDWNEVWRTRFSSRYQSMRDYPLLSEMPVQGIWSLAYFGTTTLITYQADVFAKFLPNSYFGLSVAVHTSKNSITLSRIPYRSDFELSSVVSYTFPFGLSVTPRLSFVDRRTVDLFSGGRLPERWVAGLRAEYSVMSSLRVLFDASNITDRRYEEWRGYRASPLMISGGVGLRW